MNRTSFLSLTSTLAFIVLSSTAKLVLAVLSTTATRAFTVLSNRAKLGLAVIHITPPRAFTVLSNRAKLVLADIFTIATLALTVVLLANTPAAAQGKHQANREKQYPDKPVRQNHITDVNPFIGTTKSAVLTRWGGNGGTYPGAVAPSGMIQLSPETRITGAKGYDYTDHQIYFFSCIKHYSGFPEGSSGHLFIMPVKGGQDFTAGLNHRPFRHQDEQAEPGYYKVAFTDDQTTVEASASLRTGMFRFTFPKAEVSQLFIGDAGEISFIGNRTIHATLANTVISFSEDILDKKPVKGGYLLTFKQAAAGNKGTSISNARADANSTHVITLKLSTSTVDHVAAQRNIDTEINSKTFDQLRKGTSNEWQKQLSAVDITDPDQQNKTVFYTALYHSLLIPWVISDSDGRYRGADGKIYHSSGKYEYGGFSPWDTFRSLHPLLSLLYPEKQKDAILSMLDIYQQTGHLPTESMTGNHAVPIIVDAWLKGIRGYDQNLAYTAMKKNLMEAPFVQNDMEIYHQKGYVPSTNSESVTRTVEYAYNDWALGQFAKLVMHDDTVYQLEQQRGMNYRNLFHPQSLFMLPRTDDNFKLEPGMTGYKEGDKWVYSWFVPHNAKDLVNLMGGNAAFAARLDSALSNDVLLYDNETVLHLPYLFNTAGYPGLTQKWIRDILVSRFRNTPGGLPGNDDLGSMSSAYLFNAIGIFPVSPGRPLYAIAAPLFQSVQLHLADKKTFTITARAQSRTNPYVQSLQLNKHPYGQLVIAHDQIMQGGSMEFVMGNAVNKSWPKEPFPLALSETKTAADISIVDYKLSKSSVGPHEQFWIHFNLLNKGSLGTQKVMVSANGKPLLFKHVLVPAGATLNDSLSCRLYDPGEVLLSLKTDQPAKTEDNGQKTGGAKAAEGQRIIVIEPTEAAAVPFQVSALKYNAVLPQNALQKISYVLQNLTGKAQVFHIPVMQNELLLFMDTISLRPGKTKLTEHQFTAHLAGLQAISIGQRFPNAGGGMSAKFKVYSNNMTSLVLDLAVLKNNNDTIADRSGFNNNAVIHGKASTLDTEGSRILLGDDSFIEVPNAVSLDQMGESLSMMCWVYPESGKGRGLVDMLTKGDHHVLQTNNNRTLTFFAGGWGRGDITIDLPVNWMKTWHHLAGVCQGDQLWLYVDGKLSATAKMDAAVNLSADSRWQIGRNEEFPSERVFHGYIDQVKVYEQALTAEQIKVIVAKEQDLFKKF